MVKCPPYLSGPGHALWHISNAWQRQLNSLAQEQDLTAMQFTILAGLRDLSRSEEPVSQAILARHLNADRMMVSQLVRALEKKGLIMRGDSTIDSRSKSVLITGKGNKLVEVLMPDVNAAETKFFAEGSPTHKAMVTLGLA